MKVNRRLLSQTALSAIHLMRIAALPTPTQGQGCPCQPLATHALFGININECMLGSSGSGQMGSIGEAPSLWLWKGGCKARCPQASWPSGPWWKRSPAPSSLEMSMSKHVGKEAGSQHFGFIRTRHPELEGPCWAAGPVPTLPWTGLSGPCGNSLGSSGFSYIWFKHTTTQFSAKS